MPSPAATMLRFFIKGLGMGAVVPQAAEAMDLATANLHEVFGN